MLKKYLEKSIIAVSICLILIGSLSLNSEAETANAGNESNSSGLVLTIEDAEKKALANSNDLKMAEYNIEQGENARNTASEAVRYGDSAGTYSALLSLIKSDISWEGLKKDKEAEKDAIKKSVYQKYTDVLNAQAKLLSDEKALKYSEFQRLAAQLSYQIKKGSLSSKNSAERAYLAKEVALNESRNNLDKCYRSLNTLLGLAAQERPVLQYEPQFSAFTIGDLEVEILRNMDINPDIWQAEKDVEQAQLEVDLHSWNSGGQSYASKQIAINKAGLSAADAKEQAREKIISSYNSIYNLEQQYKSKEQELLAAQESLDLAELKYSMGMIAKGDLLKADADLASLQQALKSSAYEHEVLKTFFYKPWVN